MDRPKIDPTSGRKPPKEKSAVTPTLSNQVHCHKRPSSSPKLVKGSPVTKILPPGTALLDVAAARLCL